MSAQGFTCSAMKDSGLASYTKRRCERGLAAMPPYSSVLHGYQKLFMKRLQAACPAVYSLWAADSTQAGYRKETRRQLRCVAGSIVDQTCEGSAMLDQAFLLAAGKNVGAAVLGAWL